MSKAISKILVKILKSEGLRYTDQRQAIWDEIRNSNEHRDAEDIYLKLKKGNVKVSRATVYRSNYYEDFRKIFNFKFPFRKTNK